MHRPAGQKERKRGRTWGERERDSEREDDRSSGMPVVAIEKLLIRDARQEIQFRGSLIVQRDVDRYTGDVNPTLRQLPPGLALTFENVSRS